VIEVIVVIEIAPHVIGKEIEVGIVIVSAVIVIALLVTESVIESGIAKEIVSVIVLHEMIVPTVTPLAN
jgi:hypothetical protein